MHIVFCLAFWLQSNESEMNSVFITADWLQTNKKGCDVGDDLRALISLVR